MGGMDMKEKPAYENYPVSEEEMCKRRAIKHAASEWKWENKLCSLIKIWRLFSINAAFFSALQPGLQES
jgi:hypothetical protein